MKSFSFLSLIAAIILSGCAGTPTFKPAAENKLRAPAYPLVTIDPYTSAWSFGDKLNDGPVRHWTGKEFPLIGALRVDGVSYCFMGVEKLPLKVVIPTARKEAWTAQYTESEPRGDWKALAYQAGNWKEGKAAFGTEGQPNLVTPWNSHDIWVRRTFTLDKDYTSEEMYLEYSHDDNFELYINGMEVVKTGYEWHNDVVIKLTPEVTATLKQGENIIAAHCYNKTGGGLVDFGLNVKQNLMSTFNQRAVQKSVTVMPTQTYYTFECGPVSLDVIFTAPLLMDNLDLMSRPVNYITYRVASTDGKEHDVQIYFDATPQWAVNTVGQKVMFETGTINKLSYLKTGTIDQPVLQKKGDDRRIDWGYFLMAATSGKLALGGYDNVKKEFIAGGNLPEPVAPVDMPVDMTENMSVLAYANNLGKIAGNAKGDFLMLAYDDIYSIQYFGENLRPYWNRDGKQNIQDIITTASKEYGSILARCEKFDAAMMKDAAASGGVRYSELCALAYRQALAAHKLVQDKNDELLFLSKENFSNGSIGTVDVTYPSAPLMLIYNPELVKGLLNHIFHFSESGRWTKPFAAHDVGTYPLANGQTYPEDMPVEECGNMIILTNAITKKEGNPSYALKHWKVLTTWTDYLVKAGLDPENQLCTDDFAGHLAHNANLSVKAIMGIASYSQMASMAGKTDTAKIYMDIAREMAAKWVQMADNGDHYRLTFDKQDTWSQKYNLVWDKIFGTALFDPSVAKKEVEYYKKVQTRYGIPLDNRNTYTKSDWIIWSACLADNQADFEALVDPVYNYANETGSRIPLSDWHQTTDAQSVGFRARSVVGGYFMKMLVDKMK
ncbi:MAG: DUF4965 domain-containing protein [Bacteroidales bacterium]